MFYQRLAGYAVAGDDIHYARRQTNFGAQLGERQRRQRSVLRGLQHYGVSGRQRWSNFPGQHQQWKIPGNNLSDNAASNVSRKFLVQQLGPSGMVIKMARHQGNIDVPALANGLTVL